MLKRSRTNMESMSAAVLFIPDQSEITHLETADYRWSANSCIFARIFYSALDQFLSDVGGAAGLVLGVSLATLVGFLDCCLVSFFRFFHLRKDLLIYRTSLIMNFDLLWFKSSLFLYQVQMPFVKHLQLDLINRKQLDVQSADRKTTILKMHPRYWTCKNTSNTLH